MPTKIFLISPADCSGKRAQRLMSGSSAWVANQLRTRPGAKIADVFTSISSLYFRAKLNYATRFQEAPLGCPGVYIIAPGRGLLPPETRLTARDLEIMGETRVDPESPDYATPLARDAMRASEYLLADDRAVLLGSIATEKYLRPLAGAFGSRLFFPAAFVGRGSMSRGSVLLRAVESGRELDYVPAESAVRYGSRPLRPARGQVRGRGRGRGNSTELPS